MSDFRRRLMMAIRNAEALAGYRKLTGIIYDGHVWYDTGMQLCGADTVKISFKATAASCVFGCFVGSGASTNYSLYVQANSSHYMRYNGGTYSSRVDFGTRYNLTMSPTGSTGMRMDSTWQERTFTASTNMLIGDVSTASTVSDFVGTIYGNVEVVGKNIWVPVERVSDGAIGYYDMYSKRFIVNQGTGTPIPLGYVDSLDPWENDGKIWAYINVTDISSPTTIGHGNISRYNSMEIDGVSVTPTATYQFSTTGEHLVKLGLGNGAYQYTFFNIQALVRCYFPDDNKVTTIPNDFFQLSKNLSFVRFPINTKVIGARAFMSCTSLVFKDLSLSNLTTLNTSCFQNVPIQKISNLGKITSIPGNYVFSTNASLKSIVLPETINQIGNYAFDNCTSLKTITCKALTPPTLYTNVFRSVSPTAIYVPDCVVDDYKAAAGWSQYASVIYPLDNGMVYFTVEYIDGTHDVFEMPEDKTWAEIVANNKYNHGIGKITGKEYTLRESELSEGVVGLIDDTGTEYFLTSDTSDTLLTDTPECGEVYVCNPMSEDGGEES